MAADAPPLRIREIELHERPVRLRLPFRFGVVTLRHCPQAFVRVRVERADGRSAWGAAAELMAPKWFDKNLALSNDDNFDQLRRVLAMAREAYLADAAPATAFGHFARHHEAHRAAAAARGYNALLAAYGPALIDRAVLDAACRATGAPFATAIAADLPGIAAGAASFPAFDPGLDPAGFLAGLAPAPSIAARHTVGLLDAIRAADVAGRVDDGLPESLEEAIAAWGHRWFKLKVSGRLDADLDRLEAIAGVLDALPGRYQATLDGNEQYADADSVAALCAAIRARPALARLWSSIAFIEQPIARARALEVDLRDADLGKPVIIDESDGELDAFVRARARGYAGVSSKTCKGVYRSLLNAMRCARWNAEGGVAGDHPRYFMSAEDLTTQAGLAVQQDLALVGLLGIAHVERNGHYYVNGLAAQAPAEQDAFLHAHPDLYERSHGAVRLAIRDGRIALGSLNETPGYASGALPDFAAMAAMAAPGAAR